MGRKVFVTKEYFLERMNDFHSGKYSFLALPEEFTKSTTVNGSCLEHSSGFSKKAGSLLQGRRPCRFCCMRGLSSDDLRLLAERKWSDRWDFSETQFVALKESVTIKCREHGIFQQKTKALLEGRVGCKVCIRQTPITRDSFIQRARAKHGDQIDYGFVSEIKGAHDQVELLCREHQEKFSMDLWQHLKGSIDCSLCSAGGKALTRERFIHQSKKIWGGERFDYSKVPESPGSRTKLTLKCLNHQIEFEQTPDGHFQNKDGCLNCESEKRLTSLEEFVERSRNIWGPHKYDYSRVILERGLQGNADLKCLKHNRWFEYSIFRHLQGLEGCINCRRTFGPSKLENELSEWIEGRGFRIERNNRNLLDGKEIDIWIPSQNLAIEFNGLFWHSEDKVGRNHHSQKSLKARNKGIRLVHIWEDDWTIRRGVVEKVLLEFIEKQSLDLTTLKIEEIGLKEALNFWSENSLKPIPSERAKTFGLWVRDSLFGVVMVDRILDDTSVKLQSTCVNPSVLLLNAVAQKIQQVFKVSEVFFEEDFSSDSLFDLNGSWSFKEFRGPKARGNFLEDSRGTVWDSGDLVFGFNNFETLEFLSSSV